MVKLFFETGINPQNSVFKSVVESLKLRKSQFLRVQSQRGLKIPSERSETRSTTPAGFVQLGQGLGFGMAWLWEPQENSQWMSWGNRSGLHRNPQGSGLHSQSSWLSVTTRQIPPAEWILAAVVAWRLHPVQYIRQPASSDPTAFCMMNQPRPPNERQVKMYEVPRLYVSLPTLL